MLRSIFLSFVKLHVLYHAAREPVYGLWLIEELSRHGYSLSPGTLYPTLHSLERAGYLISERRVVGGRARRYYTATPAGHAALEEAGALIAELAAEVLEGEA
ncbi:MAG TPA: PadR family transcriptional regulator [Chloroflexi bacterium]|nr:PadR family transcriptional regulator [Chloroflexota bacterium]